MDSHHPASAAEITGAMMQQFEDRRPNILMLGCGNSRLTELLYKQGYRSIVNIDFSPVVIQLLREKYEDLHGVQCKKGFDVNAD